MKMYVLVRNDLSNSQKAVQAGHALAQYLFERPDTQWDNGTLVYLRVRNEQELIEWQTKIGNRSVCFREPDLSNEVTAIAVVSDGRGLEELRLL